MGHVPKTAVTIVKVRIIINQYYANIEERDKTNSLNTNSKYNSNYIETIFIFFLNLFR